MCKSSAIASDARKAKKDETLGVGLLKTTHGVTQTFGAFREPGRAVHDCVVCVTDGMKLTLSGIPTAVQKRHKIGEREVATFRDIKDRRDMLEFDNGATVDLIEFNDPGVAVFVGVKQEPAGRIETRTRESATA